MATSFVSYPTYDTTRVCTLAGASNSNCPEALVVTLFFVFFINTVAPGKGAPFSSVTVPVTDFDWANVDWNTSRNKKLHHRCGSNRLLRINCYFFELVEMNN